MEIKLTHKNKWRIIALYSQNMKETMESLKNEIKEEEEGYLILGGDFNTKTGREEGLIGRRGRKEEEARRSRDKMINRERRIMINDKGKRMDDSK